MAADPSEVGTSRVCRVTGAREEGARTGTGGVDGQRGRSAPSAALSILAIGVAAAAVVVTWRRLFIGMDLQDESYYVLVPWRWALGDRPFVNEQNLLQFPGFIAYPFVKAFGILRDYDVTGIILYTRHLYLLLMIGVAAAVFLLARRLVRWQLALIMACVFVTYIFWATPQLSYNTLAIAFLTLSVTFGCWVVLELGGPRFALASGVCLALAVVAYPSLFFIVPFWGVFLAFAQGRRASAMIAETAFAHPPDPGGPSTGPAAWRALWYWVVGGLVVLVPLGLLCLSFGPQNLWRSWKATMVGARVVHQLGGASKAIEVAQGAWRFLSWRPWLLVLALVVYLVYRRWPRLGRALLAAVPAALWLSAQRPQVWGSGYVFLWALLVPYVYLFLPQDHREPGARILIWTWTPALIAGAMTAYTSANGYVNAAVGLAPAVVAGVLFLCWTLEAVSLDPAGGVPSAPAGEPSPPARADKSPSSAGRAVARRPALGVWLAVIALTAVVAVTVIFQFQFQQRDVPRAELTSRFTSGPWWGIAVTPARKQLLDTFAADLAGQARAGDQLLVFFQGSGYYLYWKGPIAAEGYWLWPTPDGLLPEATISYYRRRRLVPTLVVHLTPTAGMTDAELQASCGGLEYPPTLVRPFYAFQRKPANETTAEVLARLPRLESR